MTKKIKRSGKGDIDVADANGVGVVAGDWVIANGGGSYNVEKIAGGKVVLRYRADDRDDGWYRYGEIEIDRFRREYSKLPGPLDEVLDGILKASLDVSHLRDHDSDDEDGPSRTTASDALVPSGGAMELASRKAELERKAAELALMERVLEAKRSELRQILHSHQEKIKKIEKVIGVLELYMGVHEEIVQIREGAPASEDVPVSLRQLVLYMDEEVAQTEGGGWDYDRVEDFDAWLLKPGNLQRVLPEEKGVVVFKPRRREKEYGSELLNIMLAHENRRPFILIRNGGALYRVTAPIQVSVDFFPGRGSMEKLLKLAADKWSHRQRETEERLFSYKQNALLLQGLVERSDIFRPLPEGFSLFDDETWDGAIRFVYDAEETLGDGRPHYSEWKKRINADIAIGSRVLLAPFRSYEIMGHDRRERIPFKNVYETPDPGIYTIERTERWEGYGDTDRLVILYNPGDEIRVDRGRRLGVEYRKRQKAIPFYLFRSDEFVLNYDQISLDDVEYYLESRLHRADYLEMMPVLRGIRAELRREMEWEGGFIELLAGELGRCVNAPAQPTIREAIAAAIDWWKYKVKWKRPLTEDDAKALRMVRTKVARDLGLELTDASEADEIPQKASSRRNGGGKR